MKEKTTIKQKHMKKILMMFALLLGVSAAWAQQSSGDYYEGLTRKIGFSQMIPPHGLEITYDKTVHVIFPAPVKYVDLGSTNLIAGKADGAENVIRVKATTRNFREETNMSVITEDGNFYTFNVKYADEPLLLLLPLVATPVAVGIDQAVAASLQMLAQGVRRSLKRQLAVILQQHRGALLGLVQIGRRPHHGHAPAGQSADHAP